MNILVLFAQRQWKMLWICSALHTIRLDIIYTDHALYKTSVYKNYALLFEDLKDFLLITSSIDQVNCSFQKSLTTKKFNNNWNSLPVTSTREGALVSYRTKSALYLKTGILTHLDTPWKHQKNQRFSDVFCGYQKRSVAWNGLEWSSTYLI